MLNKQGGSVWIGGGGSSVMAIPLGDIPRENKALETKKNRWTDQIIH